MGFHDWSPLTEHFGFPELLAGLTLMPYSQIALFFAGRSWVNAASAEECTKASAQDVATYCTFHCGGVVLLFDSFIIRSFCNSHNASFWIWTGNYTFISSLSTDNRQYKSKPKSHLVGRAKERQSKGKWKIATAFKLHYMTDVWAKNVTILWCLYPSRCECLLPIFIWMPRNVSKLLGFYNIYSAKDKLNFW